MADTTARYGWPYQEATDPPDGAAVGQDLAEAVEATVGGIEDAATALDTRVDDVETDIAAIEAAWTTYAPTFSTPSGSPSVGTGGVPANTARRKKVGRLCTVAGILRFGTTGASGGTGEFRISLPFTAATVTDISWIGSAYLNDSSAGASGHFVGSVVVASGATYMTFVSGTGQVTGAAPYAVAAGDSVRYEVTYETDS